MAVPVQLSVEHARPLHVDPVLRQLQHLSPVHRVRTASGGEAWRVTGYRQVRQLLEDSRLGRSHPDPDNAARTGEAAMLGRLRTSHETEKADHLRMRTLLRPQMAPGRMRAARPRVEELTAELLDRLAAQDRPADLHAALAQPLPGTVIAELLGVPLADRDRFQAWTHAAGYVKDHAHSEQGLAALVSYGRELVARKRREPADDIISRLCAADPVDGVDLDDEAVAVLSMTLLFGGEATVMAIGLGVLTLLSNPAQWQALLAEPALIPTAIEEILRGMDKGGDGIVRYAQVDVEVGDVTILAGELVLLDTGAANHDDTVFPEPDRLDVTRQVSSHLAFGHGVHYCIGTALARLELQVVLAQLIPRFPAMRLAVPVEELRIDRDILAGGLVALPVTW
ncbi:MULTISPECIES: cytochrome P450 [Actinoalloteichus]|uniref:Cytochrome P450 n=1 Tax=Actinoalloteichus fjordicus TaxID=1612552 RepID=A0AAC9PTX5_9PSEU|nr:MULTISPECIES: cytochrome P450 [Actinoalloteichus]APU16613.1 cytochrome P450 [Actinoalloteichus fjordicus]APU22679.1 cytochrome P450 [Actinoalloteichus sp. GBA129-24]